MLAFQIETECIKSRTVGPISRPLIGSGQWDNGLKLLKVGRGSCQVFCINLARQEPHSTEVT